MNTSPPARAVDHGAGEVAGHWNAIYATRETEQLSWTQPDAGLSAEIIDALPINLDDPIVDVGGGAGVLVDHLLAAGHWQVTMLDAAEDGLHIARQRLEHARARAERVDWVVADVRSWGPRKAYRVWHDRAVFHFLTKPADRARYREQAAAAVAPGGFLVIATFAADGPSQCSGLPVVGFDAEDLAQQFAPSFETLRARDEHHHTPSGDVQHFTWLTLQRRAS